MAVLKYKDGSGIWHRLSIGGSISEAYVRQKTKDVVREIVESLDPDTSSISDIVTALQDGSASDSTTRSSGGSEEWIERKIKDVIKEKVEQLDSDTSSVEDVITELQNIYA